MEYVGNLLILVIRLSNATYVILGIHIKRVVSLLLIIPLCKNPLKLGFVQNVCLKIFLLD